MLKVKQIRRAKAAAAAATESSRFITASSSLSIENERIAAASTTTASSDDVGLIENVRDASDDDVSMSIENVRDGSDALARHLGAEPSSSESDERHSSLSSSLIEETKNTALPATTISAPEEDHVVASVTVPAGTVPAAATQ
jgi:hypothetical protein